MPEHQRIAPGDILPALPGMKEAFLVTEVDPPNRLLLTVPDATFGTRVSWEFLLRPLDQAQTRLLVRGHVSPHWLAVAPEAKSGLPRGKSFIERIYGILARLPQPIMLTATRLGHQFMQALQLRGIKRRAEA